MKRRIVSMAFLTGVLFMCVACSANASTPELPPENNVKVEETAKPEPLAQSNEELPEISLEELEAIFEDVYTSASGNHPEDWSVDFQITDEIGKINKAIPDDKKAPSNLRAIYIEWRTERTTPETPEPEPEPIAEEAPEEKPVAQQPTQSNSNNTTSQGDSGTQSDSGGAKPTPGGDGSFYADANGGSNGKNFKASDLIVNDETWDDIDGTIYSGYDDTTSSASNDTSGAKPTPGGDGSTYADANGGSNGKTFNASDLYVDPDDAAFDISDWITG